MKEGEIELHPNHRAVVDRFISACQSDDRILAAFLGGSYARGAADAYSDLDLYLIVAENAFDEFILNRSEFMRRLGEPIFLEHFNLPNIIFYFFANGAEGELGIGRESEFSNIHSGPYNVLVDKNRILDGVVFSQVVPDPVEQIEKLRRLIYCFWHDLSHFITALGRGQLWWAQGQLEMLRGYCVNLARLGYNFSDSEVGDEPYFKIEKIMPVEQLAALRATFCPIEKAAMLNSCNTITLVYKELAIPLAQAHAIKYPEALERILLQRLEDLPKT